MFLWGSVFRGQISCARVLGRNCDGKLSAAADASLLANFLVNSLLGAVIRAKCDSSTTPLQAFAKFALDYLRAEKDE